MTELPQWALYAVALGTPLSAFLGVMINVWFTHRMARSDDRRADADDQAFVDAALREVLGDELAEHPSDGLEGLDVEVVDEAERGRPDVSLRPDDDREGDS